MTPKIIFQGKEYASVDEMPPEVRQRYEKLSALFADKNQNGVPDMLEGFAAMQGAGMANFISFGGQSYISPDQMPPEAREAYEKAMSKLSQVLGDENHNGIPDMLEGALAARPDLAQWIQPAQPADAAIAPQAAPPDMFARPAQPAAFQQTAMPASPSAISGDVDNSGRNLKLFLFGVAILLVLAVIAGALALLLFRQYL